MSSGPFTSDTPVVLSALPAHMAVLTIGGQGDKRKRSPSPAGPRKKNKGLSKLDVMLDRLEHVLNGDLVGMDVGQLSELAALVGEDPAAHYVLRGASEELLFRRPSNVYATGRGRLTDDQKNAMYDLLARNLGVAKPVDGGAGDAGPAGAGPADDDAGGPADDLLTQLRVRLENRAIVLNEGKIVRANNAKKLSQFFNRAEARAAKFKRVAASDARRAAVRAYLSGSATLNGTQLGEIYAVLDGLTDEDRAELGVPSKRAQRHVDLATPRTRAAARLLLRGVVDAAAPSINILTPLDHFLLARTYARKLVVRRAPTANRERIHAELSTAFGALEDALRLQSAERATAALELFAPHAELLRAAMDADEEDGSAEDKQAAEDDVAEDIANDVPVDREPGEPGEAGGESGEDDGSAPGSADTPTLPEIEAASFDNDEGVRPVAAAWPWTVQNPPPSRLPSAPPSTAVLRGWYARLNEIFFGGRLPADMSIELRPRMTRGRGLTRTQFSRNRMVSSIYLARDWWSDANMSAFERMNVLVHEMCHAAPYEFYQDAVADRTGAMLWAMIEGGLMPRMGAADGRAALAALLRAFPSINDLRDGAQGHGTLWAFYANRVNARRVGFYIERFDRLRNVARGDLFRCGRPTCQAFEIGTLYGLTRTGCQHPMTICSKAMCGSGMQIWTGVVYVADVEALDQPVPAGLPYLYDHVGRFMTFDELKRTANSTPRAAVRRKRY